MSRTRTHRFPGIRPAAVVLSSALVLALSAPQAITIPEARHRFIPVPPNTYCNQGAYLPIPNLCINNYETSMFIYAVTQAKSRGAAAWTFHNEKLFRLGSDYAQGMSQVEDQFLQQVGAALAGTAWPRQ